MRAIVGAAAIAALATAAVIGCDGEDTSEAPRGEASGAPVLRAFVSVPPQAYLARKVGGNRVAVEIMVPPGRSPATYEPKPSQMAALDGAEVYFRVGVPFEKGFVDELGSSHPDLRVVDTTQGLELRPLEGHDHGHGHSHGPGHDPHTWLDPELAIAQGEAMTRALADIDPEGTSTYESGMERLRAEFERTDAEIREMLAPVKGARFHVFHPAFGYFAEAYGLEQVAIEVEGKEPSPRQVAEIIEQARADNARVIFVQPQFATSSAEAIAREVGADVVTLDPLAEDLPANLMDMAVAIRSAIAPTQGGE
jgi:zinc transport system substrate-binding protein